MISLGHNQESIRPLDILAQDPGKDPKEHAWSKQYRDEKFKDSYVLESKS
jgi:hypothetical protein